MELYCQNSLLLSELKSAVGRPVQNIINKKKQIKSKTKSGFLIFFRTAEFIEKIIKTAEIVKIRERKSGIIVLTWK